MSDTIFYSVKDLSKEEKLLLCFFLYKISCNFKNILQFSDIQKFYKALVTSLELEKHSEKIIAAVIKKLLENKKLTPIYLNGNETHPFEFKDNISENYKEDPLIEQRNHWCTKTESDINLTRAVFCDDTDNFSKIVAYTFFYESSNKNNIFTIPEKISIPDHIFKLLEKTDRVKVITENFGLTKDESILLNFGYLFTTINEFDTFISLMKSFIPYRFLYSKCTEISEETVSNILNPESNLVSSKIMSSYGILYENTVNCILTNDISVFFQHIIEKDKNKNWYDLNSFSVKRKDTDLILRLLENNSPVNILLYGAPGSGKTEYARALAHRADKTTYIFKNEFDDTSNIENLNRLNSFLSQEKKNSVIIIDNNQINKKFTEFLHITQNILKRNANKVFWIMESVSNYDTSTLWHFTYSVKFNELSSTILKTYAESKLNKIGIQSELQHEISELCGKYHITGSSIDNVVKAIDENDLTARDEKFVIDDARNILESNSRLLYGKNKMRENVKDNYDLSILNTSVPAESIVNMVTNACKFSEENESEKNGIRMLFYGLSGTGKTELARYIAEKLNKKILLKRASDILGMYVGETEKNIAAAFDEAEESGDILLFDEADSFFADRTGASKSWERTQVNEFLTQMEEFSGILICTTNLKNIMDPAMQRRFHILAEFKSLKNEGVEKLLKKTFPGCQFDSAKVGKLLSYNSVTPGDFGSLTGKIRFMEPTEITPDFIIDELCKLQEEKGNTCSRKIGFSG